MECLWILVYETIIFKVRPLTYTALNYTIIDTVTSKIADENLTIKK